MNVWTEWISPAAVLLGLLLTWAGVLVARRQRVGTEAARAGVVSAAAQVEASCAALDRSLEELQLASATVVHLPGPVRHDPPRLDAAPEGCGSGEHDWSRRTVTNVRHPAEQPSKLLCSVTWHCGACAASRHEQNVPPPLSLAVAEERPTPTVAARARLDGGDPDQATLQGPPELAATS